MPENDVIPMASHKKLSISCGTFIGSERVTVRRYSWAEFRKKIATPTRTQETIKEYRTMSPEDKSRTKDVGFFIGAKSINGGKKGPSFPLIEMLSLDGDFAPRDWAKILKTVLKCEWAAYTTHSHRESSPRVRIIIPTRRPMTPAEHAFIIRFIAAEIGENWFDPSGFRPTQPMFWPSVSSDGVFHFEERTAFWADPDTILTAHPDWMDRRTWPIASKESDAIGARAGKVEDPTGKKGVVGAFCRAYDIPTAIETFIPEAYKPGTDSRLTYSEGSTVNGAIIYGDGLWLYSHHGSDPIHGRLANAFDLVRIHKFLGRDEKSPQSTAANHLPSFLAMMELARDDPKVRIELHKERLITAGADFEGTSAESHIWMEALMINDKGAIKPTYGNCISILENDRTLRGCAAWNLFAGKTDQRQSLEDVAPEASGEWSARADGYLREFFERQYRIIFPAQLIHDALEGYALKNPYHPVQDWFAGLEWDGIPRAEKLFCDYLGAVDSGYNRAVCRKMLLAAYWRVFVPGTKFDFVVILEGVQGVKKSTFWKILAKDRFSELSTFDPKAAAEIIKGCWFVEIAELDGFNRYEIEQVKGFFSKTRDRYREAYGRRAINQERQCVFVGSTNNDEYLQDRTGNRRYWPVRCHKSMEDTIDTEGLEKVVDQVWAEVAVLAKAGERLFLDDEELRAAAQEEQASRVIADEWQGAIGEWLSKPANVYRYENGGEFAEELEERSRVCILELWVEGLLGDALKLDIKIRRRLGAALRDLGWETAKSERFGKYGKQKAFRLGGEVPF